MTTYTLTSQAQRDLDGIADYLTREAGVVVAMKVINAIEAGFQDLAENPGSGHYRDELLDRRHKFWAIYSYLIVYRWQDQPVSILAVVHGARNLETFLARRGLH